MIRAIKQDENYLSIECDRLLGLEMYEHFSFMVPNAKFMPQFRSGKWDGYVRLYDITKKRLPLGLLLDLFKFARDNNYHFEYIGGESHLKFSDDDILSFKSRLPSLTKFDTTGNYEYQWHAVDRCLRMTRLLCQSPTGSGKSHIIYLVVRFLLEQLPGDILIVVPTISLTTQLFSDFSSYVNDDFSTEDNVSILGGGRVAENKRVLISTYQSLILQTPEFFDRFTGGLIVDECHLAESKSITSVVLRHSRTPVKLGFTGTLSGSKCSEIQLKSLFGPVFNTSSTRELQDKGIVSGLNIRIVRLKYPQIERNWFWTHVSDYQKEVDWLSKHEMRNAYIVDLALKQSPMNTLILYNFVSHGKALYERLVDVRGQFGNVFLINGKTPPVNREAIRRLTEESQGVIIVASSALFSTGVNIKNLSVLIFSHSYKGKIRNLQSIGRSLRLHKDKDKAVLYDITDDLSKGRKKNITLKHMVERVKIYQKEGFNYELLEVDIDEQLHNPEE